MEISGENNEVMTTSRQSVEANAVDVTIGGYALEEVETFKYLVAILNKYVTFHNEMKKRLAIATSQLAKLKHV